MSHPPSLRRSVGPVQPAVVVVARSSPLVLPPPSTARLSKKRPYSLLFLSTTVFNLLSSLAVILGNFPFFQPVERLLEKRVEELFFAHGIEGERDNKGRSHTPPAVDAERRSLSGRIGSQITKYKWYDKTRVGASLLLLLYVFPSSSFPAFTHLLLLPWFVGRVAGIG